MMICDAQVHIWAADTPERPWPGGRSQPHTPEPLSAEGLLKMMDEAGIHRAVLVPPSWEGDRNDLALAAAQKYPDRLAVMGRLPLELPESQALMPDWKKQKGMLGMRFTFHIPQHKAWLTDGTADWLWPAAEKAGVPLMILPIGSLPVIDKIAAKYPGLRLVIDHLARASRGPKDEAAFTDFPDLLALAKHPNVAVKASGLMGFSTESYPWKGLHKYIKQVVDAFGPQRVFWGTDITRLPCTYKQAITFFTEELDFLSESDKEWIMGRGICEWLGWELPSK